MKVLGLGCAAVDVILNTSSLPKKDGFSLVSDEKMLCGGSCANTLYTLSNLGIETSYIGKLGGDIYGKLLLQDFDKHNIKTFNTVIKEDGTTLHTFITVSHNGEKCIFSNVGDTLLNLKEEEVSTDILKEVNIFFTDMFPSKPSIKIAKMCKKRNVKVISNLQCDVEFMNNCNVKLSDIQEIIKLSDYFITNKQNFSSLVEKLFNNNDYEKFINIYGRDKNIIITDGSKDTYWYKDKISHKRKAFNINAVDSTGAGDAFLAGIIYSHIYKQQCIQDALIFSNACGAIKCREVGPRVLFDYKKVYEFIKNNLY